MTADVELIHPAPGALRRAGDAVQRIAIQATAGWRLPALITLAAALIRFIRLGHPPGIIPLDETYYAPNSYGYLCHGSDMEIFDKAKAFSCHNLQPTFAVHPPVGKLLIAVGIRIFGYDAFGWRSAAAFFGSLSVLVIYLIGRRLWQSRWLAAAAAVLLGVEGLQFVQSRIAMLDIFLSFFILLGVWLLLEDRLRGPGARRRWFLYGSGIAFGLAGATKWSAAFLLPVVFAVAAAWELVERPQSLRTVFRWFLDVCALAVGLFFAVRWGRWVVSLAVTGAVIAWEFYRVRRNRRAASERSATLAAAESPPTLPVPSSTPQPLGRVGPAMIRLVVAFMFLPLAVYMLSYTPWFLSTKRFIPPLCNDPVLVNGEPVLVKGLPKTTPKKGLALWLCDQREIANYHRNLQSTDPKTGKPIHPYMSKAWSWPWISRPAAHYYTRTCEPGDGAPTNNSCPDGSALADKEILGLPNPVIWWAGFFLALPLCIWWMLVRRDDTAALLVVLFAPLVLPWFLTTRPLFMFYMTPASPFLVLMVVHVMHVWRLRWTAVAFVVVAVGCFAFFYPILAAFPLPPTGVFGWENRIWFGHVLRGDCVVDLQSIRLLCWI